LIIGSFVNITGWQLMTVFNLAGDVPRLATRGWKSNLADEPGVYSQLSERRSPAPEAPRLRPFSQRVNSSPTQGEMLFIAWLPNQSVVHSANYQKSTPSAAWTT